MKCQKVNGAFKVYMKEDWSDWWPFPTSELILPFICSVEGQGADGFVAMKVHFDGFDEDGCEQGQ
jgi:hypothetical protein